MQFFKSIENGTKILIFSKCMSTKRKSERRKGSVFESEHAFYIISNGKEKKWGGRKRIKGK